MTARPWSTACPGPEAAFRIGAVHVVLRTRYRRILRQYCSLYREFEAPDRVSAPIVVEVDRTPWSLRRRRTFEVRVDGEVRYRPRDPSAVLPHVEWGISWHMFEAMPSCLQIHAASMEFGGCGIVFAGHAGSGKSTLAIGLLARGWRYLCDEFALIDTRTLTVQPYPRAICAKETSFPLLASLGIPLHENRVFKKGVKGRVGFVKPMAIRSGAIGRCCPVSHVFFPRYSPGARPAVIAMSRAETALALHEYCFNLLRCDARPADVLAGLVRGVTCYRLVVGDLRETCDLTTDLVVRHALTPARIA